MADPPTPDRLTWAQTFTGVDLGAGNAAAPAGADAAQPADITLPPVTIADGDSQRAFEFAFAEVRTDQGGTPENGQFGILVTQGGNRLGSVQGVPAGVGLRIETVGFLKNNPVVSVAISGQASVTRVVYDGSKFNMQTDTTNFSVTKMVRVDPKAKEYSFQVSRHDDSRTVSVKSSELQGTSRERVAAGKVGVGVDKVISVSGDLSNQDSSGSKSEKGSERTEQWAVRFYTGALDLVAV